VEVPLGCWVPAGTRVGVESSGITLGTHVAVAARVEMAPLVEWARKTSSGDAVVEVAAVGSWSPGGTALLEVGATEAPSRRS